MGRPRGNQRDGFTASGAGRKLNDEFQGQRAPAFVAKYRRPPYLQRRNRAKGAEGGDE